MNRGRTRGRSRRDDDDDDDRRPGHQRSQRPDQNIYQPPPRFTSSQSPQARFPQSPQSPQDEPDLQGFQQQRPRRQRYQSSSSQEDPEQQGFQQQRGFQQPQRYQRDDRGYQQRDDRGYQQRDRGYQQRRSPQQFSDTSQRGFQQPPQREFQQQQSPWGPSPQQSPWGREPPQQQQQPPWGREQQQPQSPWGREQSPQYLPPQQRSASSSSSSPSAGVYRPPHQRSQQDDSSSSPSPSKLRSDQPPFVDRSREEEEGADGAELLPKVETLYLGATEEGAKASPAAAAPAAMPLTPQLDEEEEWQRDENVADDLTLLMAKFQRKKRGPRSYEEPKTRPKTNLVKTGSEGHPVDLYANYFVLESAPNCHMYQYHVYFAPEIDSVKMKRGLLLNGNEDTLGPVNAFDGMMLYLPIRLPKAETELWALRRSDGAKIQMRIKMTAELAPDSPQCLQVYNILFRRYLFRINYVQIGRNFFDPKDCIHIPEYSLRVMPGYITSILRYEKGCMLNIDVSHKILRSNTVLDIMNTTHAACRSEKQYREAALRDLGGGNGIIMTPYNNKTHRLDGIAWDMNPMSTFVKNGSTITFVEYFRVSYGFQITVLDQPLLFSNPTKKDLRRGQTTPIYLLPEFCILTGLSDAARSDYRVMNAVGNHTRIPPEKREQALRDFIVKLNDNEKVRADMAGWGLTFAERPVKIKGRVLLHEPVLSGETDRVDGGLIDYPPGSADWSSAMRGRTMVDAIPLDSWLVVYSPRDQEQAADLFRLLKQVCPPVGMKVVEPWTVCLNDDNVSSYLDAVDFNLSENEAAVKRGEAQPIKLVLMMVPSDRKDRYDALKKFCCVDCPVPSQVVVSKTLRKKGGGSMSVATKIALQLNCKMGGEIWRLNIPLTNMMVVGIDTYHDSAKKGQSVVGFVASLNEAVTKYYSRVVFQSTHMELVSETQVCYQDALKRYKEVNGHFPSRIVVYRDGVGDGQLEAVYEVEVQAMLRSFKVTGGENYTPKCTVIVVKKRINARFFATQQKPPPRNPRGPPGPKVGDLINPQPGTVIDTVVTKPDWYDFFLVSQSVRQGTVTPTHYNVIHDTGGLKVDHVQRLSYKLCHLYYNWPGTIRVPAPCQYAHKVAFLVGQSVHRAPSKFLSDSLYFL